MATERVLHIPGRVAGARLPVEPRLPHQPLEEPAVDVAAVVVPNVDDEPFAVERRIEIPRPLGDVVPAHRPQMHVPDVVVSLLLDREPPRVLPFCITKVPLALLRDRRYDDLARRPSSRLHAEQHLPVRLV